MFRPSSRNGTNKRNSARRFRQQIGRTKAANFATPMRGGWRL